MHTEKEERTPAPSMGFKATAFVAGAAIIGVGINVYSAWDLLSKPISPEWIALVVLTIATGWATLRIPSMPASFSISDTFSIIAALTLGPSAGALTAAVDSLVVSLRLQRTRRSIGRLLFNMAGPTIGPWVGAHVFFLMAGEHPIGAGPLGALRLLVLLTVFGALNFLLSSGIVAMAVAFERKASIASIWRTHFLGLWVSYLGGIFASMLMMALSAAGRTRAPIGPFEVLILIAPLPVILFATFRHATGRAQDQIEHLGGMNRVYVAAIEALATAIDAKDQVTHDHIRRVQDNSVRLARALGVTDDLDIQALKAASLLHDVGKISVPEHILNKPGRLTESEFQIMKRHAPVGADILSVIGFPYPVEPIVRHHHENWDGTGYPDGIAGEQIPIGARILQVVDCFDALTSDRPYRPRLDDRDALKIIADRRGTMYDPRVVDAFFAMYSADGREAPERSGPPVVDPHAAPMPKDTPAAAPAGAMDVGQFQAFDAFYELGAAMAAESSADGVGRVLWDHLQPHLDATAFVLLTHDEASDSLAPAYRAGDATMAADARIRVGDRLSGWVAATRQPILNSDARLDLDFEVRDASNLRSALAVPMCDGGRTIGVLAFYSDRAAAFNDVHQRIAEAAARIVASHPAATTRPVPALVR